MYLICYLPCYKICLAHVAAEVLFEKSSYNTDLATRVSSTSVQIVAKEAGLVSFFLARRVP